MTSFYDQIAHPLLTNIKLTFDGFEIQDVYPRELPDLFLGSAVVLTGRYSRLKTDEIMVHLQGQRAGDPWIEEFRFAPNSDQNNAFIPRLWATRRVGDLLDRVRVEGETPQLAGEIESLGLRYGIVTPYTIDIVQGQVSGPASIDNMQLYHQDLDGDGRPDINKASGAATVGARAQNLAYQQSRQANQAIGANIIQSGEQNLAQLGYYAFDMQLFVDGDIHLDTVIDAWIDDAVDHIIIFGSDAYFELAMDPIANKFMQAGPNVVFEFGGDIIAVQSAGSPQFDANAINQDLSFGEWIWSLLEAIFQWR
jgi:hypothetical protein